MIRQPPEALSHMPSGRTEEEARGPTEPDGARRNPTGPNGPNEARRSPTEPDGARRSPTHSTLLWGPAGARQGSKEPIGAQRVQRDRLALVCPRTPRGARRRPTKPDGACGDPRGPSRRGTASRA
eukprot:3687964-Pyramimonas_sp.AAC.1